MPVQSLIRVLFLMLILIGCYQPASAAVLVQYVEVDPAIARPPATLTATGFPTW
jgi:hypothetical protein